MHVIPTVSAVRAELFTTHPHPLRILRKTESINNSPPQQASLRLTPLRNEPRFLSHTIFNLHQHKSLALIFVATFPCKLSSSTLYFDTICSYTQLSSTRYSLNRYNVPARCQCACRHSKRLCEPFRILSNKECVSA